MTESALPIRNAASSAAPDFTEDLIWLGLSAADQARLLADGFLSQPSAYAEQPYVITRKLIEEGRRHLLLRAPIELDCPVRLLHGMADPDVPVAVAMQLARCLAGGNVIQHLIKDGDHRLSRPQDLALLFQEVAVLSDG